MANTAGTTKILSAKLGLTPTVSRPSRAAQLHHRAMPLPMPGSHAALLRRLFAGKSEPSEAGGKKDADAR